MIKSFLRKRTNFLLIALLLIFAILSFLWDFSNFTKTQLEREINSYMEDIREQSAFSLKSNLEFLTNRLELQAHYFDLQDTLTETQILEELAFFAGNECVERATIVALDGIVYSSSFGIQKIDPAPYEEAFQRSGVFINKPRYFNPTAQQFIDISTPVRIGGQLFGSLSISYDSTRLQEIFNVSYLDGNCAINLAAGDGTMISRISKRDPPPAFGENMFDFYEGENIRFLEGSPAQLRQDMLQQASGQMKYESQGKIYSVSYAPSGVNDWYVAAVVTDEVMLSQADRFEKMAGLLAIKIISIMALVALLFFVYYLREGRKLQQLKDSYRLALTKSNDLFYEVNLEQDTYVDHSEHSDRLFFDTSGATYSQFIERYSLFCAEEDRQSFLHFFMPESLKKAIRDNKSLSGFEYQVTDAQKVSYWFEAAIIPVSENEQPARKLICIENDITERRQKTDALKKAAHLDGLTLLYNKVTAEELIKNFLQFEGKDGQHAMFMMDIDCFKEINDRFGHVQGDLVIAEFGKVLSSLFRRSDILGRIGGDEFVAFMKDYSDLTLVADKAKQINDCMRNVAFDGMDNPCGTSISIGISLFQTDGSTFEALYQKADTALYASKHAGKDRFAFFNRTEMNF